MGRGVGHLSVTKLRLRVHLSIAPVSGTQSPNFGCASIQALHPSVKGESHWRALHVCPSVVTSPVNMPACQWWWENHDRQACCTHQWRHAASSVVDQSCWSAYYWQALSALVNGDFIMLRWAVSMDAARPSAMHLIWREQIACQWLTDQERPFF